MFDVKVAGLERAVSMLLNIQKQVRFATFMAVNKTSAAVQDHLLRYTDESFVIRGNWLRRGGAAGIIKKVTPYKVFREGGESTGHVFIGPAAWWMTRGKVRRPGDVGKRKPRSGFVVPIYTFVEEVGARKRTKKGVAKGGQQFKIGGVYFERRGKAIHPVAVFKTAVNIPLDWKGQEEGERIARKMFEPTFETELAKAIAKAK